MPSLHFQHACAFINENEKSFNGCLLFSSLARLVKHSACPRNATLYEQLDHDDRMTASSYHGGQEKRALRLGSASLIRQKRAVIIDSSIVLKRMKAAYQRGLGMARRCGPYLAEVFHGNRFLFHPLVAAGTPCLTKELFDSFPAAGAGHYGELERRRPRHHAHQNRSHHHFRPSPSHYAAFHTPPSLIYRR